MKPEQLIYDPKHGIGHIKREDPYSMALRFLVHYDDKTLKWLGKEAYHRQVAAYNEAVKTGKPMTPKAGLPMPSAPTPLDPVETRYQQMLEAPTPPDTTETWYQQILEAPVHAKTSEPVRLHFERK